MAQRWRILAALTFARAAMGFQFQSVAAAAPFLTTQLDLDRGNRLSICPFCQPAAGALTFW